MTMVKSNGVQVNVMNTTLEQLLKNDVEYANAYTIKAIHSFLHDHNVVKFTVAIGISSSILYEAIWSYAKVKVRRV